MREVVMAIGTSYGPPGTLPSQASGFVGREAELGRVRELLRGSRLVTITGTGGVGKTRLALRAAAEAATGFPDGVHLIDLAAARDPGLLAARIAAGLGVPRTAPGSQLDELLGFLGGRELLLILDTCEHLVDGCAALSDTMLRAAPGVTILATSRQPLDAAGEATFQLQPLPGGARLTREQPAEPVFRMPGTIREFGAERLRQDGAGRKGAAKAAVCRRFIAYYLTLAERFAQAPETDQLSQYQELRREHPNLRAAFDMGMAFGLGSLAFIAAAEGQYERAAWLFGASAPLWERTGRWYTGSPAHEALHQVAERTTRAGLGDDRFWRLRTDGAAVPLDEAIARALSDAGPFDEPA
jgi:hypothetical protein